MNSWYIFFILIIILCRAKRNAIRMRQKKMIAAGRNQRRMLAEGKAYSEVFGTAERVSEHIGERLCFMSGKGAFDICAVGTVNEVKGCWAEIETRAGKELINLNCLDSFTVCPEKTRARALAASV